MAKCRIENLRDGSVYVGINGKRFLLSSYMSIEVEEDQIDEGTKLLQRDGVIQIHGSDKVAIPPKVEELVKERAEELGENKNEDNTDKSDTSVEEPTKEVPREEPKKEEAKEEAKEEVKVEAPVTRKNKKHRRPEPKK